MMLNFIIIVLAVFLGFTAGKLYVRHETVSECQKQHNVHRCEIVAVPVKGE